MDQADVVAARSLLRGGPGWITSAGEPLRVMVRGRRHRLRPIVVDGRSALLLAAPLGSPLPDHATRLALRKRLLRVHPHPLVVYADRLRGIEVWQWRDPETGVYRERSGEAGTARLEQGLQMGSAANAPPAVDGGPARRAEAAILPALLARIRRRNAIGLRAGSALPLQRGRGALRLRRMREAIEESDDPARTRAFRRALSELTVLDPACGSGERLVAALELLAALHESCLERMQIWLDELARARVRHRPERLRDFRRLLARADDRRRYASRRAFVLEESVRRNLFGIGAAAEDVAACRERLRELLLRAGCVEPLPDAAFQLRAGDTARGFRSREAARSALGALPGAAEAVADIEERLESLDRACSLLRRLAAAEDGERATLCAADPALESRLRELRDELDRWCARAAAIDAADEPAVDARREAHRPLHLWLEFHGVIRAGGFDVVLGEAASRARRRDLSARRGRARSPERAPRVRERPAAFLRAPGSPSTAAAMDETCIQLVPEHPRYPEKLWKRLEAAALPALALRGNVQLLNQPLLALFTSVQAPAALLLRTMDFARELRDRGTPCVGGFQAPLERECLDLLLRGSQPLVVSPARSVQEMRLPTAWREALAAGRLLLVSRFTGRQRRPTAQMAEARNVLVAALADRVFIAHATPGGRSYALARDLLAAGRPVFTLDDIANSDLLRLGARPVRSAADCFRPASA